VSQYHATGKSGTGEAMRLNPSRFRCELHGNDDIITKLVWDEVSIEVHTYVGVLRKRQGKFTVVVECPGRGQEKPHDWSLDGDWVAD
jgi:hypothetical protein